MTIDGQPSDAVFVDTDVLIYARDGRDEAKQGVARTWLDDLAGRGLARTNLQILNELTRWLLARSGDTTRVKAEMEALRSWGDAPVGEEEVDLAWKVREHLGYGWFDCLLVAAAARMRCRYFLTEDMGDRAVFGPVTLINPFRASSADVLRPH